MLEKLIGSVVISVFNKTINLLTGILITVLIFTRNIMILKF